MELEKRDRARRLRSVLLKTILTRMGWSLTLNTPACVQITNRLCQWRLWAATLRGMGLYDTDQLAPSYRMGFWSNEKGGKGICYEYKEVDRRIFIDGRAGSS